MIWDSRRWPNFSEKEVSCPHCGELNLDAVAIDALDRLQRLRNMMGEPLRIMSGHRCAEHNAAVGGAPNSMHLKMAFDIAIEGHDRLDLYSAARAVGFNGFGFMDNGLHVDRRPIAAHWDYGPISRKNWAGIMPPGGGTFERLIA